jgi:uncharacterized cupredoxin-like copper-binding protein
LKRWDVVSLLLTCIASLAFRPEEPKTPSVATDPVSVILDPAFTSKIDWPRAEPVEVLLSNFDFTPRILPFRAGTPYRLVLKNRSTRAIEFSAPSFFRTVLLPSNNFEVPIPASFKRIEIKGGQQVELEFIARTPGEYKLLCTHFGHSVLGMTGKLVVTK